MTRKWIRGIGWALILVIVLIAALIADVYVAGRPARGLPEYVAMGSSFAAGPAISQRAENSPWFCMQSQDNYAHQLARLRKLSLVDVSCGGATTWHILQGGQLMQPAQIDAVTAQTRLVTVTIGGNDIGYLGNIIALGCNDATPWYLREFGACKTRSVEQMEQGIRDVQLRLGHIIDQVHRKSPDAKVVLLTYETILPESGTCALLGLTAEQVTQMRTIGQQLADATRAAAQAHGALLLDAASLSQGHDVCASDAWVNEMHPARGVMGAPLHPRLAGMTASAQALNELLRTASP